MSYEALHALARDSGVSAGLAWLWPLVVDGFIVVASMSLVRAVIESRRTWHPWALLLLFSTISVAGNVAHGPPTVNGRLVAAVPPVALVLAFDLLMRQVQLTLRPPRTAVPGRGQQGVHLRRAGSEVRGFSVPTSMILRLIIAGDSPIDVRFVQCPQEDILPREGLDRRERIGPPCLIPHEPHTSEHLTPKSSKGCRVGDGVSTRVQTTTLGGRRAERRQAASPRYVATRRPGRHRHHDGRRG